MIKYQYALNNNSEIVHISSLSRELGNQGNKYFCVSCDKELIPKLGDMRIKHFAHKESINCSGETYLHNLGKKLFLEEYNKCKKERLPFYIELTQNKICNVCQNSRLKFDFICNVGVENKKYNLLECLQEIELEKRMDNFIPDILLYNKEKKDVVFIEIAVTHSSEDKKLKSSKRIIELSIDKEEDLDIIKNHLLSEDDEKVKFYNFKKKDILDLQNQKECKKEIDLFILYKSGKCILRSNITINDALLDLSNKSIQAYDFSDAEDEEDFFHSQKFQSLVSKMYLNKFNVKNCYICKYHGINYGEFYPIYCKL